MLIIIIGNPKSIRNITCKNILDDLIIPHPAENSEFEIRMFKELQVTDSFLGLNEIFRGCQEREMYDTCIKNSHVDKIRKSCGCLPLGLKKNKNVILFIVFNVFNWIIYRILCVHNLKRIHAYWKWILLNAKGIHINIMYVAKKGTKSIFIT